VEDYGEPFWDDLRRRHTMGDLPEPFARMFFARHRPMFELHDLTRDPHELENLAGQPAHAALERELKTQLAAWMIRERDYLPLPIGK
jgi:N-sulfoglucosamine sulfohydrolase